MTPDDDLVRIGEPDLLPVPEVDEVHVSCVFTWHVERAKVIAGAWAARLPGVPVRLGGPAFGDEGGEFVPVTFLPGYARGMAIVGNHAVVGLSRPRESSTFSGLPLEGELSRRDAEPRCGIHVVDLATGDTVEWLRIDGVVQELYDVVALPGVVRPMAIGFKTDEIQRSISIER